MPLLSVTTNRQLEPSQSEAFLKQASERVAAMLGKPERYVMVSFVHNSRMLFAGDDAPLAYLELKSIGLPVDRTAEFSQVLCDLVTDQLEVPPDRVYIEFSNAERHLWGWNSATF